MSAKGIITALLIFMVFVGLQAVAWFVAASCGYRFGTEQYGQFSAIAALFALVVCPAIIVPRHSS